MTAPLNRRAFLKLSGALGVAVHWPASGGVRLASAWPLLYPHHYFPNPETLLARDISKYDLLLIPAYAAAELIQADALQTLPGPPGRAHDPDGVFTWPDRYETFALPLTGTWPNQPRLVVGAALWAQGYSPNDSHPGHLAQIEKNLLACHWPTRSGTATLLIEYDWVIPRTTLKAQAALGFLTHLRPLTPSPRSAIPLMPYPPVTRAQIAQLWTRLTADR